MSLMSRARITCSFRPNRLLARAARHGTLTEPRPQEAVKKWGTPETANSGSIAASPEAPGRVLRGRLMIWHPPTNRVGRHPAFFHSFQGSGCDATDLRPRPPNK